MAPLALAFFAAALALIGKLAIDAWSRHHQRCSVAAGLAGEIGAYLTFFRRTDGAAGFRAIAGLSIAERKSRLSAVSPLPSGHPVFDEVAGQLGVLSVPLAHEVSRIYNIVTGMRLIIGNLSSDRFAQSHDAAQKGILEFIASTIDTELPNANTLVVALDGESRRWPWKPVVATGVAIVAVGLIGGLIWYFGFFADAPGRIVCAE